MWLMYALVIGLLFKAVFFRQLEFHWKSRSEELAEKTYRMELTAIIRASWHIYSQSTPDGGSYPTKLVVTNIPLLITESVNNNHGKLRKRRGEAFGVDVIQLTEKVELMQVSAKIYTQRMTLHQCNVSLGKLLNEIKKQIGFAFK